MSEEFQWPGSEPSTPSQDISPPPAFEEKKSWDKPKGDKKWVKKESTWIPRLPLYATIVANADITESESRNLVQIASFLVSKGFKIRYALHNKNLAALINSTIDKKDTETYVPWKGFDDIENADFFTNNRAKDLMGVLNTSFKDLPNPTQNIIGINCSLMYGAFCECPSSCLITHTADGCVDYKRKSKETGYASSVIELANRMNIPVYNTGNELTQDRFSSFMSNY